MLSIKHKNILTLEKLGLFHEKKIKRLPNLKKTTQKLRKTKTEVNLSKKNKQKIRSKKYKNNILMKKWPMIKRWIN